jgi:hypothetical protein
VIEAVGDGLPHRDAGREYRQPRTNVGEDAFAASLRLPQVDVELACVNAFGVLIQLGAAGAPSD